MFSLFLSYYFSVRRRERPACRSTANVISVRRRGGHWPSAFYDPSIADEQCSPLRKVVSLYVGTAHRPFPTGCGIRDGKPVPYGAVPQQMSFRCAVGAAIGRPPFKTHCMRTSDARPYERSSASTWERHIGRSLRGTVFGTGNPSPTVKMQNAKCKVQN